MFCSYNYFSIFLFKSLVLHLFLKSSSPASQITGYILLFCRLQFFWNFPLQVQNQWLQLFAKPVASFLIIDSSIFSHRFQRLFSSSHSLIVAFPIADCSFLTSRLHLFQTLVPAFFNSWFQLLCQLVASF